MPTPSPTATPPLGQALLWGDDDCDADVDAVDALKNLQQVAGFPSTKEPGCPGLGSTVDVVPAGFGQLPWGDVDCDQDIDAVDALGILRSIAAFPVTQQPNCPEIGSEVVIVGPGK